jgi:hypothetical protein
VKKAEELTCGIAAGPIDKDCLTTLYGGGGRSLHFRAAFVPYYTARCIIRTIAARGIIKLFGQRKNGNRMVGSGMELARNSHIALHPFPNQIIDPWKKIFSRKAAKAQRKRMN